MSRCRRTTLRLDDALLREARRYAIDSGRTLAAVIEDALRDALSRQTNALSRKPARLPTYGRGGLLPGVDLDDSAALADIMRGR